MTWAVFLFTAEGTSQGDETSLYVKSFSDQPYKVALQARICSFQSSHLPFKDESNLFQFIPMGNCPGDLRKSGQLVESAPSIPSLEIALM